MLVKCEMYVRRVGGKISRVRCFTSRRCFLLVVQYTDPPRRLLAPTILAMIAGSKTDDCFPAAIGTGEVSKASAVWELVPVVG